MVDWGGKVATWFGAVAGVSATLAALIAATAKQPMHGWTRALFIVLVVIAVVSFAALLLTGPRALWAWWRRRHDHELPWEDPPGRRLGEGLGALIPPLPEPATPEGPLELALEGEDWDLWQGCAWIAAVKVRITNVTTQVIRLTAFELESDPGAGARPKLTQGQVSALFQEITKRREAYGSSHLRRMDLQPGDSTSGWLVRDAYLPFPARAGRPRCVFRVTDGIGDIHEMEIPARDPQVRRIGPDYDRL